MNIEQERVWVLGWVNAESVIQEDFRAGRITHEIRVLRLNYLKEEKLKHVALPLARKYAEALGELDQARKALKACAGILAGGDMTKRGLTDALELARAALASAPEERP